MYVKHCPPFHLTHIGFNFTVLQSITKGHKRIKIKNTEQDLVEWVVVVETLFGRPGLKVDPAMVDGCLRKEIIWQ